MSDNQDKSRNLVDRFFGHLYWFGVFFTAGVFITGSMAADQRDEKAGCKPNDKLDTFIAGTIGSLAWPVTWGMAYGVSNYEFPECEVE